MKITHALQDAENESEQIQLGDAGSDQYQGSTDETKQVINQDGDNNETVQESSNIETQVQVGSEDDIQVQNSDVVTDQSATTNGDDNTVTQSSTNDTTQSQTFYWKCFSKSKL